jgi:tetratricopeptide (TPR) repeat protein
MNTKQLIDQLIQRLNYYREEHAIMAHIPSRYELEKRIQKLESQIEILQKLPLQQQSEIDNEELETLLGSLPLDFNKFDWRQFNNASQIVILRYENIFIENQNSINIFTTHVKNDSTVQGNNNTTIQGNNSQVTITQQIIETQPIPRFLTKSPFIPPVFLGRDDDLQEVHQQLFNGTNFLMLVNGQGGIGKTTFAAKYWELYQDEYSHLAFLFVENGIIDGLLSLSLNIGLQFTTESKEEQLEILLQTISNLKKPCLLILDNANDRKEVEQNIETLRSCPNFHILMTSRVDTLDEAITYKMNVLKENFPLELFKFHYPKHKENENDLFWSFFNLIEGNTLVIEIIAKNLKEINSENIFYSLQDLLKDFEEKGILKLSEQENIKVHWQNFQKDKPETILKAMYDLKPLSDEEKQLLSIFSVLPADNIAYSSLITLLKPENEREFSNTYLKELVQKGWIERNYIQEENHYKISPVIQAIVRDKNEERLYEDCEKMIISLIYELNWEDNINYHKENYKYAILYSSYVKSIINYIRNNENKAILFERVGDFYIEIGNITEAFTMYEESQSVYIYLSEQNPINFKKALAISYSKLGNVYQKIGNLDSALELFEKVNELCEQLYIEFPTNTDFKDLVATSYQFLGVIHQESGNLKMALNFFKKGNYLTKQLYTDFTDNTNFKLGLAVSYQNLGSIHRELGNLRVAINFFEKNNDLTKQLYQDFPKNVDFKDGMAISFQFLGIIHQELGNLKIALNY